MRKVGCLKRESPDPFPGRDAARSSCGALLRRTGIVPKRVCVTTPALQRTAPQELRAALRPGNARRRGTQKETLDREVCGTFHARQSERDTKGEFCGLFRYPAFHQRHVAPEPFRQND